MTLKEIFARVPADANAEALKDNDGAVIDFNLTGEGGGRYHISIKDGKCVVAEGSAEKPNLTISMLAQDFINMVTGKVPPQLAFLTSRLELTGDLGLGMKMQTIFPPKVPQRMFPNAPEDA